MKNLEEAADGAGEVVRDDNGNEVVLHPPCDRQPPVMHRGELATEEFLRGWREEMARQPGGAAREQQAQQNDAERDAVSR